MKYVIVSIDATRDSYKCAIRDNLSSWEEVVIPSVNGNVDYELEESLAHHKVPVVGECIKVGQLGRWLSFLNHLEVIDEPLLVIEDDAILIQNFPILIEELLQRVPSDADFFSLFIPRNRPVNIYMPTGTPGAINPKYDIGDKVIVRAHQPYGGVAMILYPGFRDKICKYIEANGIIGQFDDIIYELSQAGRLNGYSIVPELPNLVNIIPGIPSTVHETKEYHARVASVR